MLTGTSVLGVKYDKGVLLCADTLGSYGSLAKLTDVIRLFQVNKTTVVGASGSLADFQHLQKMLSWMSMEDDIIADSNEKSPQEIFSLLTRIMYLKRSQLSPCWNLLVVAGYRNGQSFLGYVDLLGVSYEDDTIATGFGGHLARPILRKLYDDTNGRPTEIEARNALEDSARALLYRDCNTINKVQVVVIDEDGPRLEPCVKLSTNWQISSMVTGYE